MIPTTRDIADTVSHLSSAQSSFTPTKPRSDSAPTMRSPQRTAVPALPIGALSPVSNDTQASAPSLKTPDSAIRASSRVRFAVASGSGSASAPASPRKASPRPAEDIRTPGRHAIQGSPRKSSGARRKDIDEDIQVMPSPRRSDPALIALGKEAAGLIFAELKAKNPVLNKATIIQLGRFETLIPLDKLSPQLRAKVKGEEGDSISHARLIKALFLKPLLDSAVGKTLLAMRAAVMAQYDGDSLTLVDREMREDQDPGFKYRLQLNIEDQGRACAAVALGVAQVAIGNTQFPPDLISLWKSMDRELCDWAKGNPALEAADIRNARANLGFDLLFTRLMLPLASGSKDEAELAIPSMFFASVKNALLAGWPKFVDSFIAAVAAERTAPTGAAPAVKPVVTTTTSASTTSTTATASSRADGNPGD